MLMPYLNNARYSNGNALGVTRERFADCCREFQVPGTTAFQADEERSFALGRIFQRFGRRFSCWCLSYFQADMTKTSQACWSEKSLQTFIMISEIEEYPTSSRQGSHLRPSHSRSALQRYLHSTRLRLKQHHHTTLPSLRLSLCIPVEWRHYNAKANSYNPKRASCKLR